jgi:hypothetical protein
VDSFYITHNNLPSRTLDGHFCENVLGEVLLAKKGRNLLEEIIRIPQDCAERGFVERRENDVLVSFTIEQGLIRNLLTEDGSRLFEATTEGKRFLKVVLKLMSTAERFVANCNSGGYSQ